MTAPTKARGRILYVLKMFPRFSETFILNEILELERQGLDVHIVSIKRPKERLRHAKTRSVRAETTYLPEPGLFPMGRPLRRIRHTWPLIRESWRNYRRDPERYRGALSELVDGSRVTAFTVYRTLFLGLFTPLAHKEGRRARKRFLLGGYLASLAREQGVSRFHAHFANDPASVARFASLLSGIPFSFTAHAKDIYLSEPDALRRRITSADFVVTCTDYNRDYLQKIAENGTPIRRVYHGLDPDVFGGRPGGKDERSVKPLILSVGRLVEKKGHSSLIEACELLLLWGVNYRCQIVGEGPMASRLIDQINRLGLEERVELVGFLPQEDLVGKYREASVFVLPCQITQNGDRDGIPNVLVEAMALGVPVVTSPVSGITELVDSSEVGVLVDAHDIVHIAEALKAIVTNPRRFDTMADVARHKVRQEFDLATNIAPLAKLLDPARGANEPRANAASVLEAVVTSGASR